MFVLGSYGGAEWLRARRRRGKLARLDLPAPDAAPALDGELHDQAGRRTRGPVAGGVGGR